MSESLASPTRMARVRVIALSLTRMVRVRAVADSDGSCPSIAESTPTRMARVRAIADWSRGGFRSPAAPLPFQLYTPP